MFTFLLSLSGGLSVLIFILWMTYRDRKKDRYSPFTENMLRTPGYTLSNELQDIGDKFLTPIMIIGLLPFLFSILSKDLNFGSKIFVGVFIFAGIIGALIRLRKLVIQSRKIKLGLDGEIYTGQELNYLMRKGAWVYHDIPYKYGNIDHIVISKSGIFAVETKAVRKPMKKSGGKDAKVFVKNGSLVFPHFTTAEPVKQSKRHVDYLKKTLLEKTGCSYPVFAVIALPGWFIDLGKEKNGFLVINPKRGRVMEKFIQDEKISEDELGIAAREIEVFARSVSSRSDITDPDGSKKYNLFFTRKHEEPKL